MAMFGFLSFGSVLAFLDLAAKNQIESRDKKEFPKELPGTNGKIWLYQNHNPGFSFGVLKECPKAMELVPLCVTVVDYFSIRWKWLKKVVFNLGDFFIFAGSALFVLLSVFGALKEIKADLKGEFNNEKV